MSFLHSFVMFGLPELPERFELSELFAMFVMSELPVMFVLLFNHLTRSILYDFSVA